MTDTEPTPPLSDFHKLQLEQAAKGCVSGRLKEWPALMTALLKSGVIVYGGMPALCLREMAKLVLERERLRGIIDGLSERVAKQADSISPRRREADLMTWTQQTPTQPGWYWWRLNEGSHHLRVYIASELKAGYPFCEHRLVKELGGQWAGPSDEV